MADRECRCNLLACVVAGGVEFKGLRCPACIDAILEAKNELVRENNRLREWGALMTALPWGVLLPILMQLMQELLSKWLNA